jgi:hypothetical protein
VSFTLTVRDSVNTVFLGEGLVSPHPQIYPSVGAFHLGRKAGGSSVSTGLTGTLLRMRRNRVDPMPPGASRADDCGGMAGAAKLGGQKIHGGHPCARN